MEHSKFAVTRFENRNGVTSWRLTGWLHGVRIRKNFKTKDEAAAEKATLELKALQATAGMRSVVTFLTDEQLREAETLFRSLGDSRQSLTFYVNYARANYQAPEKNKPLATAANEYVALRAKDEKDGALSHRQFTTFRCELRALSAHFPAASVADLTAIKLISFFQRGNAAKKSFNNRRGLVGTFMKYCLLHDWIAVNPIDKVPHFRGIGHRRGSAITLSAEECAEMMHWAESNHGGALVPFFALCLFAGIRPDLYEGEISKLEPKHVRLDTGVIFIEPEVSKVRMKRAVTIQPNLAAWLLAYPLENYPIMPFGFRRLRLELRKKFNLSHDVLRHTFISMHVAKFRSMGEAALQAGNSESIIRKHYLDLKTPTEAEEFFGIFPTKKPADKTNPLEFPSPAPAVEATG